MTLNDVMAVVSRYSTEFGSFGANYVTEIEVIAITVTASIM